MDWTRKLSIILGAVAVILLFVVANLTAALRSKDEIHKAQVTAAKLGAERDSIEAVVAVRDSMTRELKAEADGLTEQADKLREQVAEVEQARATAQLGVRMLRDADATEDEFRNTFPEFSNQMRVVDYAPPDDPDFPITYIMVPASNVETFIIDHANAESWKNQRDTLVALDDLNREIIALKNTIVQLTAENATAYQRGYQSAFASFETCNADYISLLKQPRFRLDVPSLAVILGSAAVGLAIGAQF